MTTPLDTIKSAIFGNPPNPNNKPSRQGVVRAFAEMQKQLEAAQAGALIAGSKTTLDAVLAAPTNAMAWVTNDATLVNNGIYRNTGTALAAIWTRITDIPQFVVSGINAGAGTVDAISVTTDLPIPSQDGRAFIGVPVLGANTVSPPTVRFNGGGDLSIISNTGSNVAIGGLQNGMILFGFISAGKFRLITNQVDSAIIAQAESAASAAEGYRDEAADYANFAKSNWVLKQFRGDDATVSFDLTIDPGTKSNVFVAIDGILQDPDEYNLSGTNLVFTIAPPAPLGSLPGTYKNISARIGTALIVNVPADDSVSTAKIQNLAATKAKIGAKAIDASKIDDTDAAAIRVAIGVAGSTAINFQAHKNATSQTGIASATATKITFGTEQFDVGLYYDAANSRFTPPAGTYRIKASLYFSAGVVADNEFGVHIRKNTTIYKTEYFRAPSTSSVQVSCECIVELNGTDYIEIYGIGGGTGNKTVIGDNTLTYFEGNKI